MVLVNIQKKTFCHQIKITKMFSTVGEPFKKFFDWKVFSIKLFEKRYDK